MSEFEKTPEILLLCSKTLKIRFNYVILCMRVLSAFCMCITDVLGIHGDHKKASDPLELELRMVVNYHVDVGDQICVLCKSNNTLFLYLFIFFSC